MKYSVEQWSGVKAAVLAGTPMRAAAKQFGLKFSAVGQRAWREGWRVAEQRCIERGKAQLGRAGELRLKHALTVASVQEVKFEVEQVSEQLRKASLRAKAAMAEQIEAVFAQLRESPGIPAIERSRALRALASVCNVLHRWDEEAERESEEDPLACKGAINLALMRMTPEQLRNAPFRSQMPEWWEEERRRGIERAAAQSGGNGSAGQEHVAGVSSQPVNQVEQTDVGMANLMRAFEQRPDRAQATSQQQERERQEAQRASAKAPPSAFECSRRLLAQQAPEQAPAPAQEGPAPLYGKNGPEWLAAKEESRRKWQEQSRDRSSWR